MRTAGLVAELDALARLGINYDEADAPRSADDPHWHVDAGYAVLADEPPGPPETAGAWEAACRIIEAYEFAPHRLLRGIYRPAHALLGRDMLLEGRFAALRFYLGVRITEVLDTERDGPHGPERVWGWTYQTLDGHLEQGRLTYEVVKELATGRVSFWILAYSRRAPTVHPILRLGFRLFGRDRQLSFYRRVGQRMHALIAECGTDPTALPAPVPLGDGLVVAPSASHSRIWDPLALPVLRPGRGRAAQEA